MIGCQFNPTLAKRILGIDDQKCQEIEGLIWSRDLCYQQGIKLQFHGKSC